MRALGELALYRTNSGSFVSYAREFVGPWAGFVSGWMFWFNWCVGGVAELTAIGIYVHKWLPHTPQWITALTALAVLFLVNLAPPRSPRRTPPDRGLHDPSLHPQLSDRVS
jgi:L-asparagine permease